MIKKALFHAVAVMLAVSCSSVSAQSLEVDGIFNDLAGNDSIFGALMNQEAGDLQWSAGGELRHRFMNEDNRLRPAGGNAEYSLWRFNPWLKMQYGRFGGFVEGIDASVFQEGNVA